LGARVLLTTDTLVGSEQTSEEKEDLSIVTLNKAKDTGPGAAPISEAVPLKALKA
jgi:hypothetical protein